MNPTQLQHLVRRAEALQQAGRLVEAAVQFARLRQMAPRALEGWQGGGNIALLLGKPSEALPLYAQAARLAPRSAVLLTCLGVAEMASGQLSSAEARLREALRLEPKNADVLTQLATVLQQQGRHADALQCHARAVAIAPRSAAAWHAYGSELAFLSRSAEALECERRALAADPTYLVARHGYAVALQKCHCVAEAIAEFDAILAAHPNALEVRSHQLLALNYLGGITQQALYQAHRDYGERAEKDAPAAAFSNPPTTDRKLRVALFSADLRRHAVAHFLLPLLQHLERDHFELLFYSATTEPDAVTAEFRALASMWRDVSSQLPAITEAQVRADAPDIAIDLAGHTGTGNPRLFAHRVAPVQITYLGYPNTTGLKNIDYRFVDHITDPTGSADQWHTETLVRFAPTAWTYAPADDAPLPVDPPCLRSGRITFGSFNNFAKVTDEMLRVWARILDRVPRSRLLLKSIGLDTPTIANQIRGRMQAAGLPLERVELAGVTPTIIEHLATYAEVDIALDTSPYNGTTTTCEALWMGVPVVSLTGDRHASRVGTSLLHAVGHAEWTGAAADEYVRIAVGLGADVALLARLRTTLRDELRRSALFDYTRQAGRFGEALRECWRVWCAARAGTR